MPKRFPERFVHIQIEPRQHHHALRQIGNAAQQPRDGGGGRRNPRCDHRRQRRLLAPARCCLVEQPVAAVCRVDAAHRGQLALPGPSDAQEQVARRSPVLGQVRLDIDRIELVERLLLDLQLVEHARIFAGEAQGFGGIIGPCPAHPFARDQRRQPEAPFKRIDRRRHLRPLAQRVEQRAKALVEIDIADQHHARQQQPVGGMAHQRFGDRAPGAMVRDQQRRAREPHRIAAEAPKQAIR